MQDASSRKSEREQTAADGAVDSARAVGNSIRQAFLTHMGEQQRQYPTALAAAPRRPSGEARKR